MYTMCLWDYKSHKKTYEKKLKKEKKVYYVDVPLFILTTGSEPVKVAINQEKSEIIKIMKKYTKQ